MFELAKQTKNQYRILGLTENPFHIAPLFKDFRNLSLCQQHEKLFVPPTELNSHIPILANLKNRRVLVYGCYGAGKTSFVDSLLYLGYNFHKRFCVRSIITEENIARAINEFLVSLCFEIVDEISNKNLTQPITYFKKWLTKKRYHDSLLSNLARLIGHYSEAEEKITREKRKGSLKVQPGGLGIGYDMEAEIEIRKSIQSYIEILPMKTIGRYLNQFLEIVSQMGYSDIVIFIDEADHISKIDQFIKMLTKSREILFAEGYTFFVSGSPEIAHYTESIGSIFDKTLFVGPADYPSFCSILEQRIKACSPSKGLELFSTEALKTIYEVSRGIRKQFLRLAENALDNAAMQSATKIEVVHTVEAVHQNQDRIAGNLGLTQRRVLKVLANLGPSSPSRTELQKLTNLTRSALAKILKALSEENYLVYKKQGRQILYSISSIYLPYFENEK